MNLATATDLAQWAERRDAQGRLPQVVRRLISATGKDLSRLSFRAGEGVALPGWDGIVDAPVPSAFVPGGLSVWEMGVGDPGPKAKDDYRKRSGDPGGVDPASTTFVFVTPRRWNGKERWARERNKEGIWKAVVVLDADDLETWLESAPAVHAWISSFLGKDPYDVESLETWWEVWSEATDPALPSALFLSGRDQEAEQLRAALLGAPGATSVVADSQSEALAFIAAIILGQGDSPVMERALVVHSPQAWRQYSVSSSPLLLLPTFANPALTSAVRSVHHVVLPLGCEVTSVGGIRLPRLRREGIEAALVQAGLHHERASSLATLGRRSVLSLRRALAINPDSMIPEWALEHAVDILPAVLTGSWDDSWEGDREVIAAIAGRPYAEVARTLTPLLHASNPPIRRVGDVWMVSAKADTWGLIARALTTDGLNDFQRTAVKVLGEDDPALELPPDQRVMAGFLGRQRQYSEHLIRGIADTLALMAAASDDVSLAGGRSGKDLAATVAHTLTEAANEDPSGRRWHALSRVLPLLAEAAPGQMLRAIEAGSLTQDGPILRLFQDADPPTALSSGSPHCSLLWALEVLAWSPDYLAGAALRLAALARLEPGGRTYNRPSNSLSRILLLWYPGTAASLEQRISVIDLLREHEPAISWSLMLQLVPTGNEHTSPTVAPEYRDWKPEDPGGVNKFALFHAVETLVERAVRDADIDGGRWAALLDRLASAGGSFLESVLNALEGLDPANLDADGGKILYLTLADLARRHRRFADANWALPPSLVDRLDALTSVFEPADSTSKHEWLFGQGVFTAFMGDEHEESLRALAEARQVAVREIVADIGLNGLAAWVANLPDQLPATAAVGYALAGSDEIEPEEILAWLASERESDRNIAVGYVSHMAWSRGLPWALGALDRHRVEWSPIQQSLFLNALPASPEVWGVAEELGVQTDRLYWGDVPYYLLPTRGNDARFVTEKLLSVEQFQKAIRFLYGVARQEPDEVPLELLVRALEEAGTSATTPIASDLDYVVGEHFDLLDERGFDESRLAQLEWLYLPLFRFEKRRFHVLHRALAEAPAFFVQVVSLTYRARGEPPRELSKQEQANAESAHDLLDAWQLIPGTRSDGTIDFDILAAWVHEAREHLTEANRAEVGEQIIGRVLHYGPSPQSRQETVVPTLVKERDGGQPWGEGWPAEPIRDLIESAKSEHIERGFQAEAFNSRGPTWRGLTEGGQQERRLANHYRQHAVLAGIRWPRTATMLNRIAESYEREAEQEDRAADLTEDTWR